MTHMMRPRAAPPAAAWPSISSAVAASMLSACGAGSSVIEMAEFCALYDPIYTPRAHASGYPAVDAQIQANNATWLCLCEGDCPAGGE